MPNSTDLGRIAVEAYHYLYPLVLMEVTRKVSTGIPAGTRAGFGPPNRFSHMRAFPPGDFKGVVRPNFDTLYSTLLFDFRLLEVNRIIVRPEFQQAIVGGEGLVERFVRAAYLRKLRDILQCPRAVGLDLGPDIEDTLAALEVAIENVAICLENEFTAGR